MTTSEKIIYGNSVRIKRISEDCNEYRLGENTEDNSVVMTSYKVFPGINLIYNDVHMQYVEVDSVSNPDIYEINHCKEGRIEFMTKNGEYQYLSKGDMAINNKFSYGRGSYFPLSHYHGITIAVNLEEISDKTVCFLDDVTINLKAIKDKFCSKDDVLIIKESKSFEHIFSELYEVPERIRKGYYKIKVLEVLLFLVGIDVQEIVKHNQYFTRIQVEKVKEIKKYLLTHMNERITLDELSAKFGISLTIMKKCFKQVYGDSVYAFFKEYKMQKAAEDLINTREDISKIAGNLGYDNASKFSAAFKKTYNITPSQYRNENV